MARWPFWGAVLGRNSTVLRKGTHKTGLVLAASGKEKKVYGDDTERIEVYEWGEIRVQLYYEDGVERARVSRGVVQQEIRHRQGTSIWNPGRTDALPEVLFDGPIAPRDIIEW